MGTSEWALVVSVGMAALVFVEKIFGGGNGLAMRFSKLKEDTTAEIAKLRMEVLERVDRYEDNYGVGFEAIKANIHELQMAALKFRAEMAEGYIPKGGMDALRMDMRNEFAKIDRKFDHIQDMIMWAAPTGSPSGQTPAKRRAKNNQESGDECM